MAHFINVDVNFRLIMAEGSYNGKSWNQVATLANTEPAFPNDNMGGCLYAFPDYYVCEQLAIGRIPQYLRLTVSRIGSCCIKSVRILGWKREYFPVKVLNTRGSVVCPEHLLADDARAAMIGEPNAWNLFHHPESSHPYSSVTLKLSRYVPYPQGLD